MDTVNIFMVFHLPCKLDVFNSHFRNLGKIGSVFNQFT